MQTTIPSPYSDMGSVPVISYMAFATGTYFVREVSDLLGLTTSPPWDLRWSFS